MRITMTNKITSINLSSLFVVVILLGSALLASMVLPLSTHATASVPGTASSNTPTVPDPPLNPTALYAISGPYTYTAAGAAMRDQGFGTITVTWTGTLVAAYLIWGIIDNPGTPASVPSDPADSAGTFNGVGVTGTPQNYDVSPCWFGNLYVFAAPVTSLVTNGANSLTGFASGDITGGDPWSVAQVAPLNEGASLVVISTSATLNQIYIYTGAYTEPFAGNPLTSVFNHGYADATTAQTTFIVADGQQGTSVSNTLSGPVPMLVGTPPSLGNYAQYNGATVDGNALPGGDPRASAAPWSFGNLWDTKTYSVAETLGATSDTASIGANGGDCLTWAGQVISIPSFQGISGYSGRMTGGGSFAVPFVLTHGFEVNCKANTGHSNLEVQWVSGSNTYDFKMTNLLAAVCYNNLALGSPSTPAALFNTWDGLGTGTLNGVPGYTFFASFTDQGQPAAGKDISTITIVSPSSVTVLGITAVLMDGAHQAHNT